MNRHLMSIKEAIDKSLEEGCPIRKYYWPENVYIIATHMNNGIVLFHHFVKSNGELKVTRYEPAIWEGIYEPEWV